MNADDLRIATLTFAGCLAAAAVLGGAQVAPAAEAASPDFRFVVRPLLAKNCFSCHGPDENHRQAELRLDDRTSSVDSGAIVPGSPEESNVMRRITSDDPEYRMPPEDAGRPLKPDEIKAVRDWIAAGANYAPHWSYEAPQRPALPKVSKADWCRNAIDFFVLARLDSEKLTPEPEADRYHLIRRLSLDLTGLPPTPHVADEFLLDNRHDAYERVVDRLLASSAYGEHWARKWLDLARYADTVGYERDADRTMWPYRDWVIHALNADMPFDQFTIEQLAGDLLPNPIAEQIIATGFHRNTMQNDEGGTDDEEFRVAAVIDRVNTTMQVWMGTTIGCCQCHSHKYDPLAQREYYQLFAFLNQSADADRNNGEPLLASWLKARGIKEVKGMAVAGNALPIMQELAASDRRTTHVFNRGSFMSPGEAVEAGTPQVFPKFGDDLPKDRLGLARWLVDRNNPLTARVAANRHWEELFGRGIVLTSEDFGSQGTLPTHPELLDWLAVELMEHDWSLKHLAKTIVMSAAYRQSARVSDDKLRRDPENRLISRGPRERLSAEQIRDQALAVSGLLSTKVGGPSVMPPQPDGVWQIVYSNDKWTTSKGDDRYRRGLYTFWRRTSPYPAAMALDATSRETCTIRRVMTNTPIAAFALLNDEAYVEAAQSLAKQVVQKADGDELRATFAFRQVLVRPPSEEEVQRILALVAREREYFGKHPEEARKAAGVETRKEAATDEQIAKDVELAAWTVAGNVLLNLDEALHN